MKRVTKNFRWVGLVLLLFTGGLFAQPANDDCSSATNITTLDGTCQTGFTTVAATNDVGVGGCMSGSENVWFTFTAQGPTATVTINGANGSRPEVAVLFYTPTQCDLASGLVVDCQSLNGNYSTITASPTGLTTGTVYYVMVTNSTGGTAGAFDICIDNPIPVPASGQDCSSSVQVCSSSPFSGNSSGPGVQEMNITNAGCLGVENNSSWYTFTANTSGTVEMSISPQNGSDDYDFAIWGPNGTCPPTSAPIRCNFAAFPRLFGCGSNSNPTGLAAGETATTAAACDNQAFLAPLNVTAGETYILMVDGFTAASQPFDLTWGGTASLDCGLLDANSIRLEAQVEEGGVRLNWRGESDQLIQDLQLQRQVDAQSWETIHMEQKSAPLAAFTPKYTDQNPRYDALNYRVVVTDVNGFQGYSNVIRVALEADEIFIFPNPASSLMRVSLPVSRTAYQWSLVDAMGRVVDQGVEDSTQLELHRKGQAAGVYYLKVVGEQGSQVKQIIWR